MVRQVIGAPSFFPTIWVWIKSWFDQNTVSKIVIVPAGKELAVLSESYNIADIPRKYGGEFDFEFGMPPSLDPGITSVINWLNDNTELPIGPMRWTHIDDDKKTAVAVGRVEGQERKMRVLSLK